MAFVIPLKFNDLENEREGERLFSRDVYNFSESDDFEAAIDSIVAELCDNECTCIADQAIFDRLYNLLKVRLII